MMVKNETGKSICSANKCSLSSQLLEVSLLFSKPPPVCAVFDTGFDSAGCMSSLVPDANSVEGFDGELKLVGKAQ